MTRKHGISKTRLYSIYMGARYRGSPRCNDHAYKHVDMCQEWYENMWSFMIWALKNGYRNDLSIDRIDPEKGYSPDNCRWIPKSENSKRARPGKRMTNEERWEAMRKRGEFKWED